MVRAAALLAVLAGSLGLPAPAHAAPYPPYIPPAADWLTTVNYYRAMSGLPPVAENTTFSAGAYQHSCYMLYNGISHDEVPGNPGYSLAGQQAGNSSNVAVSSVFGTSARSHIELWMTGPFHAIGILRHNLAWSGFGKCDNSSTSPWKSGATLDVVRGLISVPRPSTPTLFPGNGTTTSLNQFVTEFPNPLTYCGWSAPAGLPILAMMPEAVSGATGWVTGPSGPLQVCVLSAANTDGVAKSILQGDNAVVVMPRNPLEPGTYQVGVNTTARSVNWSFTVDPAAATGIMPPTDPPPAAEATADPSGVTLITPVRVVDTRSNLGTTKLVAGGTREIQITGRLGIPSEATAVLANVTVADPGTAGYLTLWNCSANMPEVSTLNFKANEVVPNSATLPLSASGKLCVYSPSNAHLILDVTGYATGRSTARYTPVAPSRVMDTRIPLGPSGRLQAGQTVELQLGGIAGVPVDAYGVALNVTSTDASASGYITVYPCSDERPFASNLNPVAGKTRANLVVTALSSTGSVCLFSASPTELIVDVVGYLKTSGGSKFTPSAPFRFTDTRDRNRIEVNGGTNGNRLPSVTVLRVPLAGVRGIPADAKAVSANLTVVDGTNLGYLTAWPCGPVPTVSNLNFERTAAVANAAILPLATDGSACVMVYNSAHVIIDVNGWWS